MIQDEKVWVRHKTEREKDRQRKRKRKREIEREREKERKKWGDGEINKQKRNHPDYHIF